MLRTGLRAAIRPRTHIGKDFFASSGVRPSTTFQYKNFSINRQATSQLSFLSSTLSVQRSFYSTEPASQTTPVVEQATTADPTPLTNTPNVDFVTTTVDPLIDPKSVDAFTGVVGSGELPVLTAAEAYDLLPWYHVGVKFLYHVHEITGTPWWLSILISAFIVRTLILPTNYFIIKNQALMMLSSPLLTKIRERSAKKLNNVHMSEQEKATIRSNTRMQLTQALAQNGASMTGGLLPTFVQLPFLIYLFYSIRYMAHHDHFGLSESSFLWAQNLALPDPLAIIPMVSGFLFMSSFEIPRIFAKLNGLSFSRSQHIMAMASRVAMIGLTIFIMRMPVATHMYFWGTSVMNVLIALLWRVPAVRTWLRLPPTTGLVFSMEHSDPKVLAKLLYGNTGVSRAGSTVTSKRITNTNTPSK